MKNPFKKDNKIDKVISNLIASMSEVKPDSVEYNNMSQNLDILMKANSYQKDKSIDLNTVMLIVGTIVQTVLILKHEQIDIITTKAMSTLLKLRV
jgi:hypothetical protein